MKIKTRNFVAVVLLTPPLLILFLAISHRIKAPRTETPNLPQPGRLLATQAIWNKSELVPISANAQLRTEVYSLPINENGIRLTVMQNDSLHASILNLILANYSGDYDAYWHFIAPIEGYQVADDTLEGESNIFTTIFPNQPVPNSFREIDRQIWNSQFSGHPYWTSISFTNCNITLSTTNQIPFLDLPELYPDSPFAFGTIRGCYISYDNLIANTLKGSGELIVATITIYVGTIDLQKTPRPFVYVLAEDSKTGTWLPVEMSYLSTVLMKYQPRF